MELKCVFAIMLVYHVVHCILVLAWCFGRCLKLADFFEESLSGWWWVSDTTWHSQWYAYLTVTVPTLCLTGEANFGWVSAHVWFPIQYAHFNYRIPIWHVVCVASYCTHLVCVCVLIVLHLCRSHWIHQMEQFITDLSPFPSEFTYQGNITTQNAY